MPFRVTGWHTFHITGEQSFWKQHRNCLPTHLTEPQLDHREAAREGTVWALGGVVQGFLPGVLFSPRKAFSNPGERLASTLLHSFLQPRPHRPDGSRLMVPPGATRAPPSPHRLQPARWRCQDRKSGATLTDSAFSLSTPAQPSAIGPDGSTMQRRCPTS